MKLVSQSGILIGCMVEGKYGLTFWCQLETVGVNVVEVSKSNAHALVFRAKLKVT